MMNTNGLSKVWLEYLRTSRPHKNTRREGCMIYYGSGVEIDLTMMKQNVKLSDTKKMVAAAYSVQRTHGNYQSRNKFYERQRQRRVEGYTVEGLQGLVGQQFIKAVRKIIMGRATLAGLG